MTPGLICGLAILVMFASLEGRHILLSPQCGAWPDAPSLLRKVMYTRAAVLLCAGLTLVFNQAVQAHVSSRLLSFVTCCDALYEVALFVNVARQHLRHDLQNRLRRMESIVRCGRRRVIIADGVDMPRGVLMDLAASEVMTMTSDACVPTSPLDMPLAGRLHATPDPWSEPQHG